MGWSGIIFVSVIGVGGFVGRPVWFSRSLCMVDLLVFCLLVFMLMARERRFGILYIISFETLSKI